jgi:hypothetical protein
MSVFRGISKRINPLPLIQLGRYNADEVFERMVLVTTQYFDYLVIRNLWNQTTLGVIDTNMMAGYFTLIWIKTTLKSLVEKRGVAFVVGARLTTDAIREVLRWKGPTRVPAWLLSSINSSMEDEKLLDSVFSRYLAVAPGFRDLAGRNPDHEDYDETTDGPPPIRRRLIGGGYVEDRAAAAGRTPLDV